MPGLFRRNRFRPSRKRLTGIGALLLLPLCGAAPAADSTEEAPGPPAHGADLGRPRVALALSGGGARGIAHVGVLKALEEMRVPIDCVAGTSMGAIVGGLYASGMSPREIEAEMLAVDWTDLFSDKPPRRDLAFRRKQDDTSDLIDLEVGINEGRFTLPRGLLAGQKIGATFETLTLHAAGIDDFDRLRLPFRAVATDIGTGGMVVLGTGHLPEAMRASMAIPGMVAPAEIDGRMLVDGGLTRNLPVDVARALCGGIVVAVDVSTPLLTPAQVRSIGDITLQVSGLLTHQNAEEQRRAADVLITPELGQITFADFRKAAAAIDRGEAAVRAAAGLLRPHAVPEAEHAARLGRQRHPADAPPVVVDAVRIDGGTRVDARAMTPRIRSAAGAPADRRVLRDDLARLYDLGEFERVDFRLLREEREAAGGAAAPAARTTLVFRPTDKPWGPNYLRFGVNFLNDFQGDTDFSVLGRLTRTRINALGAEWRTDGQFGETRRFSTEFYQPLDFTGTFFVVPRFNYSFFNTDVFDGDRNLATYRTRYLAGMLSLGAQIGRYGEVRLGAARARVDARERIGPGTLPEFDGEIAGWTGRLVFDRLDDSNFPHGGRFFLLEAFLARRGLGSELDYDKLSGSLVQVWSRGRHHAFVSLSAGTDLGSDIPFFDEYRMGGLFNLSGFREGQIRGQMFGVTRVGWYRRSGKLSGIFGRGIYVGAWLEAGNAWQTRDEISGGTLHTTGTAALGVDTFFGPLYFAYGRSDGGHDVFYLSLGRSLGGPRMFDL